MKGKLAASIALCITFHMSGLHAANVRIDLPTSDSNSPHKKSQSQQVKTVTQNRFLVELTAPSVISRLQNCQACQQKQSILDAQVTKIKQQQLSFQQHAELRGLKLTNLRSHRLVGNYLLVQSDTQDLEAIKQLPNVKAVHSPTPVQALLDESLPVIGADYARTRLDANGKNLTGFGIKVAVIDTGIDYNHPDLGAGYGPGFKVVGGYDFVDDDPDPLDLNGHGTHVAGIVAANGELVGVAPEATLLAYRSLDEFGSGFDIDIIAAIEHALDPDNNPSTDDAVDIMNLSLGGIGSVDSPLSQAVENAANAGALMVVSAGNSGDYYTVRSPANARSALAVGAVDNDLNAASFTSKGPVLEQDAIKPEVVAPGVNVLSTVPNEGYERFSGTSMAAPHVAGAAALLKQYFPNWSAFQIRQRIISSATKLEQNVYVQGAGIINLQDALNNSLEVSPALINLGEIAQNAEQSTIEISVFNQAQEAIELAVDIESADAAIGITYSGPAKISIAALSDAILSFDVNVDAAELSIPDSWPAYYQSQIRLEGPGEKTFDIPVVVHKSRQIQLEFDEVPIFIEYGEQDSSFTGFYYQDIPKTIPVRTGSYHLWAMYEDTFVSQDNIQLEQQDSTLISVHKNLADKALGVTNWRDADGEISAVQNEEWDFSQYNYQFFTPHKGYSVGLRTAEPVMTNAALPFDLAMSGYLGQPKEQDLEIIFYSDTILAEDEAVGLTLSLEDLASAYIDFETSKTFDLININILKNLFLFKSDIAVENPQGLKLLAPSLPANQLQFEFAIDFDDMANMTTTGMYLNEQGATKVDYQVDEDFFYDFLELETQPVWPIADLPKYFSGHTFVLNRNDEIYLRIIRPSNHVAPATFENANFVTDSELNYWDTDVEFEVYCDDVLLSSGLLSEQLEEARYDYRISSSKDCTRTKLDLSFESELDGQKFNQTVSNDMGRIDVDSALALRRLSVRDADGKTLHVTDDKGFIEVDVLAHVFNGVGSLSLDWRVGDEWQTLQTTSEGNVYRANLPAPNKLPQPADIRIQMQSKLDSNSEHVVNGFFWYGTNDPNQLDQDDDGVVDAADAFPLDASESLDFDNDGIGNNQDEDDDNDGMPDLWELRYNLNPLDPADANTDLDGDGASNLAEYQRDTDPLVSNKSGGSLGLAFILLLIIVAQLKYIREMEI